MIVSLTEVKKYLRLEIDEFDDDDELNSMLLQAEEYLKSATGFKFEKNVPERAKGIIKMLVAHWYDNRGMVILNQNVNKVDYTVSTLINQLKYTHFEEEETV
ncbi:phage gp6-like head-tail connector protein [Priestia aryabhattai]|uniref:head-tail connector protein n=1 Tax=Priestia aryabhattai TaxID=412384 RepID=UPI001EB32DFF|nr:head-tail connector protein [Priestia aryabhattai]MBY0094941.1 phage gp6-like head-tail connector protein [Priestia aryabhattai]MBY0105571.1 phage gp6-like head-tail connector protein [Priestia aryabhattai]